MNIFKRMLHKCETYETVKKLTTFDKEKAQQIFIEIRKCKECSKEFAIQISKEGTKEIDLEYVKKMLEFATFNR